MRFWRAALITAVALTAAQAQRHKVTINAETPEGQLLQQIGNEADEAKKLGLLEQFATQNSKHEAAPWVYEQLIAAHTKAGSYDKALAAGEKLIALDPEDVESAHATLKAAEAKKDADAIAKWAGITSGVARKIAASPKPQDEEGAEEWKRRVDFAKQVDVYTEYALYAASLQDPDPAKKVVLGEALEKQNPDSQYFVQVSEQRFMGLIQAGRGADAVALAERVLTKDQSSPEMLLAVAGAYVPKKEAEKAIGLASKAIEVTRGKAKPEGVSDADWQARQSALVARADWIIGVTHAGQSKWAEADKALRASLPGIQNDKNMLAEALFYLGLANYRLGEAGDTARIKDALVFNQQCAAIPGRFQGPANNNIKAIRAQYRVK